jgi:hypothetical protein
MMLRDDQVDILCDQPQADDQAPTVIAWSVWMLIQVLVLAKKARLRLGLKTA